MERYSFRDAHETDAFLQLDLIGAEKFGRETKLRNISLSFGSQLRRRLEELDQVGALRPIGFELADRNDFVFREEVSFRQWANYAIDVHGFRAPRPIYSPWQLLYAKKAVDLGNASVPVEWMLEPERMKKSPAALQQFYLHQDERRRSLDDSWHRLLLLLTRLQNRYLPIVRGTLTKISTRLTYDPEVGDYVQPFRRTVEEFRPMVVLEELELTIDEVRDIHRALSVHGASDDPLSRYYMLFRMIPHTERAKLSGAARRAQDAYDAAEMVRRFYHDLTGDLLPTCDEFFDLTGGKWKKQLFDHDPRLSYNREDLQVELVRHHLYPHAVHLVVEGETDELLFRSVLESLGGPIRDQGVTFSTLRGIDRARLYTDILRAAKHYARFPLLVADREGNIERVVERMKSDGLLNDETVILWDRSVEEDNFSDQELVAAAERIAELKGHALRLDAGTLRSKYEELPERVGKTSKGLAELLVSLARHPDRGSIVISKRELAGELGRILLEDLRTEDDEAALMARRPILNIVLKIARVT